MKNKQVLYFLSGAGLVDHCNSVLLFRDFSGLNRETKNHQVIYIPTGSSFEQVMDTLESNLDIKDIESFYLACPKKKYPSAIKPGRYVLNKNMSYNHLINLLRSGKQSPVKITFNNVRTLNQLAGKIGKQIEADSVQIMTFFSDDLNYISDGFSKETIIALFIPNTYEVLLEY